jgi:hypothetical protein
MSHLCTFFIGTRERIGTWLIKRTVVPQVHLGQGHLEVARVVAVGRAHPVGRRRIVRVVTALLRIVRVVTALLRIVRVAIVRPLNVRVVIVRPLNVRVVIVRPLIVRVVIVRPLIVRALRVLQQDQQ